MRKMSRLGLIVPGPSKTNMSLKGAFGGASTWDNRRPITLAAPDVVERLTALGDRLNERLRERRRELDGLTA